MSAERLVATVCEYMVWCRSGPGTLPQEFVRWIREKNCLRVVPVQLAGAVWAACSSATDVMNTERAGMQPPLMRAALDIMNSGYAKDKSDVADAVCELVYRKGIADAVPQDERQILLLEQCNPKNRASAQMLDMVMTRFGWRFTSVLPAISANIRENGSAYVLLAQVLHVLETVEALDAAAERTAKRAKLE